jgi:RNA polymerase sigma-70 factor (ECF subfamily)
MNSYFITYFYRVLLKKYIFRQLIEINNVNQIINVEIKIKLDDIINRCLRKDRLAQEQLFKLYYGKMMAVCLRYTNDKDTAQEILQDGFIKVFDKLNTFESNGSFDGWIRRIMANTALDALRKNKRLNWVEENEINTKAEFNDPIDNFEFEQEFELKANVAMDAINELSPAYKTVFNLYVFENYSHKEIAETLGISEGTSKSNLAKAKMNLQKIINKKIAKTVQ